MTYMSHVERDQRRREIIRRYEAGEKVRSIAADLGISDSLVSSVARRNGLTLRRSTEWRTAISAAQKGNTNRRKTALGGMTGG